MLFCDSELPRVPTFPETRGVAEILVERGFILDHRRTASNIHYEEYW